MEIIFYRSTHRLSSQSGFTPYICFGDILISFVWNGVNAKVASPLTAEDPFRHKLTSEGSVDSDKIDFVVNKQHDFIRTHFHRATQCDFCLKKVRLTSSNFQYVNTSFSIHPDLVERRLPMSQLRHVLSQKMHNQMPKFDNMWSH